MPGNRNFFEVIFKIRPQILLTINKSLLLLIIIQNKCIHKHNHEYNHQYYGINFRELNINFYLLIISNDLIFSNKQDILTLSGKSFYDIVSLFCIHTKFLQLKYNFNGFHLKNKSLV